MQINLCLLRINTEPSPSHYGTCPKKEQYKLSVKRKLVLECVELTQMISGNDVTLRPFCHF